MLLVVVGAILVLPTIGFHWWQDRGEWFPMSVGDRWTYVDGSSPERVVFAVLRRETDGAFVVERRIGNDRVHFVLCVTRDSVFLLGTTGVPFNPPFEEFRLPQLAGSDWTYEGVLGQHPVSVSSRREILGRRSFQVEEHSSLSGRTTFTLERGKGVVRLKGKRTDLHSSGFRVFDWTLEKFERGG